VKEAGEQLLADTSQEIPADVVADEAALSDDATGTFLGLAGDFETEKARKERMAEAERDAARPFPPAARVIRLSLREATEAAITHNLNIVVERYNPLLFERDVVSQKALLHDPIFDTNIGYSVNNTPVASIFFPSGAVEERRTSWGFGISQPTTIGGVVRAELQTVRTDTDSPLATLTDSFEPVLTLSLTQELLRGFGWNINRIALRRSQIGQSLSIEQLRQQVIDSIFQVHQGYWELVRARESLKAERLGLRLAEDLLRQNEIQVRVGTMAPLDVLQAKAQAQAAVTSVIVVENNVRQAQNRLLALTTNNTELLQSDIRIEPTDEPTFEPEEVDFEKSLETALRRRPDLHSAMLDIQDKRLAEKGAKNAVLPKATLEFATGFRGLSGDPNKTPNPFTGVPAGAGVIGTPFAGATSFGDATNTFFSDDEFSFWSVGVMVTYPIGNRDARAQYTRSKLEAQKSEKNLTRAEQIATLDVKRVFDSLEANARAVESAQQARTFAEEQLEAEEKKLGVGLSTNFEVLQFQTDLTDRRLEEIQALTQYRVSLAELGKVTGTSLDDLDIEFLED
jgi:outer membrane protein TolC